MEVSARLSSKGQVTVPRAVREALSLEEGDRLVFHLAGVREGEVAVARLERPLHDRMLADLDRRLGEEPWKDFCTPPYVSLRRVDQESAS